MDMYYLVIIVGTLVGFCALAWLLLAPIWRFLDREEKVSDQWTKDVLARRRRRQENGHGNGHGDNRPPDDEPAPEDREHRPPPAGPPSDP